MKKVSFSQKIRAHIITLPRPFAFPFFASSLLLGVVLAGGTFNLTTITGLIAGLLIVAGGHSFNSYLDYAWTGLDKGEKEDRSAEKAYTGGQNLIENGIVTINEVLFNALFWYLAAFVLLLTMVSSVGWMVVVWGILGMLDTLWYSWSKFNWTHELALSFGVGPCATMIGMYSVTSNPDWIRGILTSIPLCFIFAWAGLALDEWPDAEANLKKGVKSMAYMVWKCAQMTLDYPENIKQWRSETVEERTTWAYSDAIWVKDINVLRWYISFWFLTAYIFQVALIAAGYLNRFTIISFLVLPFILVCLVFLKDDFKKAAGYLVTVAAFYPILVLLGQWAGG